MNVIGYCRVSTAGQVQDGLGLPTQERLIRAWAKRHGHRVVRLASDNGRSGTLSEAERPGLLEAIDAIRHRDADGIVVSSLDRLARALTVQEAVLAKVWAFGGTTYTVDSGEVLADDPDDPMRTAMRQMAGVFAELERRLVVKRLRDGRATKRASGRYAGDGIPYGFRTGDDGLVEDEDEQAVIRRVIGLRAEGASYRAICAALEADGCRPRRAARWSPMVVRAIARRALGASA